MKSAGREACLESSSLLSRNWDSPPATRHSSKPPASRGDLYITQAYDLYSEDNHESWRQLFARIQPRWERYANPHFLRGVTPSTCPTTASRACSDVNRRLQPLTGFQAKPVSGYVPGFIFFDCLRRREFPTTITIRPVDRMDYLPEPDIFHDVAGHVPMHTERPFADTLVRFGDCAAHRGGNHRWHRRLPPSARAA